MHPGLTIVGAVLLVLGLVAFSVKEITYTEHREVMSFGSYTLKVDEEKSIPLSPIATVLLGGGVISLLAAKRVK